MFIVFNIGCIECGVSSGIVGAFENRNTANKIAEIASKLYEWREGGQNEFKVFEIPKLEIITDQYSDILKELSI